MNKKFSVKDNVFRMFVYLSGFITIMSLVVIVFYIVANGIGSLSPSFLGSLMPMIVTTLLSVIFTLLIAIPIGIFAAVYLSEYYVPKKLLKVIRFSIDSLVGIPSIIYGLFGMLFFVNTLKLGFSILAGTLTLSIVVLPTIIKTTEEALKNVPSFYKEGSYALGASKLRTIMLVILPSAKSGITNGVILSIGRIVGESAAVYMTIGTVPYMPSSLLSSGQTLSVHMYLLAKEGVTLSDSFGTATVLIVLVIIINLLAGVFRKDNKI